MTVTVQDITSGPYTGNDIADTFAYDFEVQDKSQMQVYQTDLLGITSLLTVDVDYSVTGVGTSGGDVVRSAGALPTGYTLFIVCNYDADQDTSFTSQGAFYPAIHENAFDKLTYLILQSLRKNELSLHLPDSYSGAATGLLPVPEGNKYLRWNSAGTAIVNATVTSSGGGSGGGVLYGVALVEDTVALQSEEFDPSTVNYVTTQGFYAPGDLGGATYQILTLAAERVIQGDGAWVPNDINSFYVVTASDVYIAKYVPSGSIYVEQYGIAESNTDNLDRFQVMRDTGSMIKAQSTGKRFNMSDVLTYTDQPVLIELGTNTLVSTGTNERVIYAINNVGGANTVTGLSMTGNFVTITLGATPVDIVVGQWVKMCNENIINPDADKPNERQAEYFYVDSIASNVVTCRGSFVFTHDAAVDTITLVSLNETNTCKLGNIRIDRTLAHNTSEFAVAINIIGYVNAEFTNIKADYFTGQLLNIKSCVNAVGRDIYAKELLDDSTDQALGYVVQDNGYANKWYNLGGGKIRHTYTTGADDISAGSTDWLKYGGAVRCHVYSGITTGNTNYAYDTHEDAIECEFHDITTYDSNPNGASSTGGFQDRAQKTIVHNLTYISDGPDTSSNGRAWIINKGSRGTHIRNVNYHGKSGRCIASSEADDNSNHMYRVDNINWYVGKAIDNLVVISEDIKVSVGTINVFPSDTTRTFFGNGGVAIKLGGATTTAACEFSCEKIIFHFDNPDLGSTTGSFDLIRLDGTVGNIHMPEIIFNATANTYPLIGQGTGICKSDTTDLLTKGFFNVTINLFNTVQTQPTKQVIRDLDAASDVRYMHKVLSDGAVLYDSAIRVDGVSSTNTDIEIGPDLFYIRNSQGKIVNPFLEFRYVSTSASSTFSSIDAPAFEGQRARLYLAEIRNDGTTAAEQAVLLSAASNVTTGANRTILAGEAVDLIAKEFTTGLAWEVY